MPANIFALAWLVVALINPMDLFSPGCQLSFLSVLILYRIGLLWDQQEPPAPDGQDPMALSKLLEERKPWWSWLLRGQGTAIIDGYKISLLVWLGVAPLVAYHYNLVPAVALLIGPPIGLLTAIALMAGFALLLMAALHLPGIGLCAVPLRLSLAACDFLVDWADRQWWGRAYIADLPAWWLVGCYLGILAYLTLHSLRRSTRWAVVAGLGWLCMGLLAALVRLPTGELRCTFLAVGHGGCTVLETPDGRVLLYDAGAMAGPQVAEQQIPPFLWRRGIRRIDEVPLSHGDLDHFNGLNNLLDRFSIGQVTCTPTFADKKTEGVAFIVDMLDRRRIPRRIVQAGDRLLPGGGVVMEVLDPPARTGGEREQPQLDLADRPRGQRAAADRRPGRARTRTRAGRARREGGRADGPASRQPPD